MSSKRVQSDVMVRVINKQVLCDYCSKNCDRTLDYFTTYGIVSTPSGDFLLTHEGVGNMNSLSKENQGDINLYKRTDNSVSMFPSTIMHIDSVDDLLSISDDIFLEQEVPLHEFIRTFGSRLESNYVEWNNHLTKMYI